ncbi:hypothetical protein [Verrucosispora sp. SN26_14.1]|nr:hypothetical protein [Verrucosispora sp. SN26_14.1]
MSHHSTERQRNGDPSGGRLLFVFAVLIVIAGLFGGVLGAMSAGSL